MGVNECTTIGHREGDSEGKKGKAKLLSEVRRDLNQRARAAVRIPPAPNAIATSPIRIDPCAPTAMF